MGKLDKKDAQSITRHVESLLYAKTNGQPLRQ
jgi:hypothetical protein